MAPSVWQDAHFAAAHAKSTLTRIAAHLRFGEVAAVFHFWTDDVGDARAAAERKRSQLSEAGLQAQLESLTEELAGLRDEKERVLDGAAVLLSAVTVDVLSHAARSVGLEGATVRPLVNRA